MALAILYTTYFMTTQISISFKVLELQYILSIKDAITNQCRHSGWPGGRVPLTAASAPPPPFRFTQNTVFGTSLSDKTTRTDGKRNNYVQI